MKKLLAVLSLVAAFGIGGVSTASAANCGGSQGKTVWQADGNYLRFYAYVGGCTDVDQVEVVRSTCTLYNICGNGSAAGWGDQSNGQTYIATQGLTPEDTLCGRLNVTYTDTCGTTFYHTPWCGGLTHVVYTSFPWRIHSKSSHQWGIWHFSQSTSYAIVC